MGNRIIKVEDFPIEVAEVDGRYVCFSSKLLLTASAPDLKTAYEKVSAKRSQLLSDAQAAGITHLLTMEGGAPADGLKGRSLAAFGIRTGIVALGISLVLIVGSALILNVSRRATDIFVSKLETAAPFSRDWDKRADALQAFLIAAASSEATPAQQARIKESLHVLALRYRPYFEELAPLVEPLSPPKDSQQKPDKN